MGIWRDEIQQAWPRAYGAFYILAGGIRHSRVLDRLWVCFRAENLFRSNAKYLTTSPCAFWAGFHLSSGRYRYLYSTSHCSGRGFLHSSPIQTPVSQEPRLPLPLLLMSSHHSGIWRAFSLPRSIGNILLRMPRSEWNKESLPQEYSGHGFSPHPGPPTWGRNAAWTHLRWPYGHEYSDCGDDNGVREESL